MVCLSSKEAQPKKEDPNKTEDYETAQNITARGDVSDDARLDSCECKHGLRLAPWITSAQMPTIGVQGSAPPQKAPIKGPVCGAIAGPGQPRSPRKTNGLRAGRAMGEPVNRCGERWGAVQA